MIDRQNEHVCVRVLRSPFFRRLCKNFEHDVLRVFVDDSEKQLLPSLLYPKGLKWVTLSKNFSLSRFIGKLTEGSETVWNVATQIRPAINPSIASLRLASVARVWTRVVNGPDSNGTFYPDNSLSQGKSDFQKFYDHQLSNLERERAREWGSQRGIWS